MCNLPTLTEPIWSPRPTPSRPSLGISRLATAAREKRLVSPSRASEVRALARDGRGGGLGHHRRGHPESRRQLIRLASERGRRLAPTASPASFLKALGPRCVRILAEAMTTWSADEAMPLVWQTCRLSLSPKSVLKRSVAQLRPLIGTGIAKYCGTLPS